jgi:dephospho-CoA kinase
MYESGFDRLVDKVIVVTAPEDVRIDRIMKRDGITADKARQWIAKQWKQDEVIKRADYEIINDGQHNISQQIDTLLNKL